MVIFLYILVVRIFRNWKSWGPYPPPRKSWLRRCLQVIKNARKKIGLVSIKFCDKPQGAPAATPYNAAVSSRLHSSALVSESREVVSKDAVSRVNEWIRMRMAERRPPLAKADNSLYSLNDFPSNFPLRPFIPPPPKNQKLNLSVIFRS